MPEKGWFYPPTLITNIDTASALALEPVSDKLLSLGRKLSSTNVQVCHLHSDFDPN